MKIGIVGDGIVGGACKFGFRKLGHDVKVHDLKYDTTIGEVINTEIVFICVPTNSLPDGGCDISIVDKVLSELAEFEFRGVVVIKSTVIPGTTEKFQNDYPMLKLAFVPEFLRERCAVTDFVENHDLLAIGVTTDLYGRSDEYLFDTIERAHGTYPKKVVRLSPTQAEFLKYYSNVFNAMRVIFANGMYEIMKAMGVDYTPVKNAFIARGGIDDIYLDVNDHFRGYGGTCLPKDVKAICKMVRDLDLPVDLFASIDFDNSNLETTVHEGMRE